MLELWTKTDLNSVFISKVSDRLWQQKHRLKTFERLYEGLASKKTSMQQGIEERAWVLESNFQAQILAPALSLANYDLEQVFPSEASILLSVKWADLCYIPHRIVQSFVHSPLFTEHLLSTRNSGSKQDGMMAYIL